MSKRSAKSRILLTAGVLLVAAVFACAAFFLLDQKQSGTEAEAVLQQMEELIPGLGEHSEYSSGEGIDPLQALSINGVDVVGCLEIPSLDMMVPVTDKDEEQTAFVTWVSGSPVKGKFRLIGSKADIFLNLADVQPASKVVFTDIDGVQYHYEVTTQLHLKSWDEGKYDLMLCYDSDDQTQFVVGCTKKQ